MVQFPPIAPKERKLKNMTMEEMLKELREQDKQLKEIFDRRRKIGKEAREKNIFNELWEELMNDHESHYTL